MKFSKKKKKKMEIRFSPRNCGLIKYETLMKLSNCAANFPMLIEIKRIICILKKKLVAG